MHFHHCLRYPSQIPISKYPNTSQTLLLISTLSAMVPLVGCLGGLWSKRVLSLKNPKRDHRWTAEDSHTFPLSGERSNLNHKLIALYLPAFLSQNRCNIPFVLSPHPEILPETKSNTSPHTFHLALLPCLFVGATTLIFLIWILYYLI